MRRLALVLVLALVMACLAPAVPAHEVRPALLDVRERASGEFDVSWKVPTLGGAPLAGEESADAQPHPPSSGGASEPRTMACGCPAPTREQLTRGVLPIHPALPEDAELVGPLRVERLPGAELRRWTIRVPGGLDGWHVAVHGLESGMMDVLVRIELEDGRVVSRLLRPEAPGFVFTRDMAGHAAGAYFGLGVEHILLGIDHLLFVLCLLLIVRGWGPMLKTVTAFTIAHSITLGLVALGLVDVPAAPVEAVIALSIAFLALVIVQREDGAPSFTERRPWSVAFTFGLLHGFGFAGALREVGLPPRDIPLSLLLFNLGVEAGQVAFIAAVILAVAAIRRLPLRRPPWLRPVPAYVIGSVACYWLIARIAAFW